jgi:transposase
VILKKANSEGFAMSTPLPLRSDYTAADLHGHARRTRDANQARRLLALAAIYDGASRGEAARRGGVGLQIVRDWVARFNAQGPDGLVNRKAPGPARRLNETQRRALATMVESGPMPVVHSVVRWRLVDLGQWLWEEFRIAVCTQTVSRELRQLGYRKLTARPRHHAQAAGAVEAFKKTSQVGWTRSRRARASIQPR